MIQNSNNIMCGTGSRLLKLENPKVSCKINGQPIICTSLIC